LTIGLGAATRTVDRLADVLGVADLVRTTVGIVAAQIFGCRSLAD
jgi:hypothetical protein